ncbi:MAG: hypothetical protein IRY99_17880, partial [Isosphaeraceae bacterium]|nr:hypothetical protein [Isosphaeraceae bacterium]
ALEGPTRITKIAPEPAPAFQPYKAPAFEVSGQTAFKGPPVQFERAPVVFDPIKNEYRPFEFTPDFVNIPRETERKGPFMGKVVSGSGDTYEVKLYPDGPDGAPDQETVTVTIPMIADDEKIEADTWINPVFKFGDTYFCQVPVWMD